jgi:hypothetical protein
VQLNCSHFAGLICSLQLILLPPLPAMSMLTVLPLAVDISAEYTHTSVTALLDWYRAVGTGTGTANF